jgi:hypothetical protein
VRTITEHVWAELHHILGYKPDKRTSFAVKKTFQIISSQLNAIDEHFNLLFEELTRFQEEVNYKDADPLNAENLPAVLDELGTGCAQREIDGLLRMLNSRGIETVHKLREVGTPANIELVSNTFRRHEKRSPTNFEIVASIAALREIEEAESKITAIETQIEFLKAWESLKRKFDPRGPGEGPGV